MRDKEPSTAAPVLHTRERSWALSQSQCDPRRPKASYLSHLETLQLLLPREHRLQPANPDVDVPDQHELPDAPGQDAKCGAQVLEKVFDEARVLLVTENWSDKSITVDGHLLPERSCPRTAGHCSAKQGRIARPHYDTGDLGDTALSEICQSQKDRACVTLFV